MFSSVINETRSSAGALVFLIKGLAIGFSIAAPVGPIGLLCIRRSLAEGRWIGLATGLGAATADAAYGAVAAFGLTAVSDFLIHQKIWLGLLGGVFLCYLGLRTFFGSPAGKPAEASRTGWRSPYFSTLLLTFTNPATILSFIAVFAGLVAAADYHAATLMVAGVFAGSALWWLILSQSVAAFRHRLNDGWMRMVNRLSGGLIFAFGIYAFWSLCHWRA